MNGLAFWWNIDLSISHILTATDIYLKISCNSLRLPSSICLLGVIQGVEICPSHRYYHPRGGTPVPIFCKSNMFNNGCHHGLSFVLNTRDPNQARAAHMTFLQPGHKAQKNYPFFDIFPYILCSIYKTTAHVLLYPM